ncbi:hypothetical protein CHS0354_030640 [Potamilus streckersoni]|uniref:F5/8 type C domain-containing protein n=1 Tax=Potamilus streckersoni TaxID=2493646 RepID=A0AAE0VW82_9BIVA|nr:hypothetical protein CHS0354_030640 [Potamilus streckersoni]
MQAFMTFEKVSFFTRRCQNGVLRDDGKCECLPCWTGLDCSELVEVKPYFPLGIDYISISNYDNYKKSIYTVRPQVPSCKNNEECPCAAHLSYHITRGNEKGYFTIDPSKGDIFRTKGVDITSGIYELEIMVKSLRENNKNDEDRMDLVVRAISYADDNANNRYSYVSPNGYEEEVSTLEKPLQEQPHHIHRRAVDTMNLTFTIEKVAPYDTLTTIKVGSRVMFRVTVTFPAEETDFYMELFTPDNTTTVMILCNVQVTIGNNLHITNGTSPTIQYESKDGSVLYDRAMIFFGNVTRTGTGSDNSIVVTYEAVMVNNPSTQNGAEYWVSAGAEYNSESEVWVGQASFTANTVDMTLPGTPNISISGPVNLELGNAAIYTVDMFIPNPMSDIVLTALSPANTSSLMSICAVKLDSYGSNFGCGFDANAVNVSSVADPSGKGNTGGIINLGKMLNKGSRDDSVGNYQPTNNRVTVKFAAQLYNDLSFLPGLYNLDVAVEIDSVQILTSSYAVTALAPADLSSVVPPSVMLTAATTSVNIGDPFVVEIDITVPNTIASQYILEVLAPVSGTDALYQVCKVSVVSVGKNMPCVDRDQTPVYTSRNVSGTIPDRAVINFGFVKWLPMSNNTADNVIKVSAVFKALNHPSNTILSTSLLTCTVHYGNGNVQVSTNTSITINSTTSTLTVMNNTNPSFSMSYAFGTANVPVTATAKVLIQMATSRSTVYPTMDVEFIVPLGDTSAIFTLCKAKLASVGKNIPCMAPEWINAKVAYYSNFSDGINDRAVFGIGNVCNMERVSDSQEDTATFELYVKVNNHPNLTDNTQKWITAGVMYSTTKMWVGQLALSAQRGEFINPTTTPGFTVIKNTTLTNTPLGMAIQYSLLVKVMPQESIDFSVEVLSNTEGLDVCTVRVYSAGENFPCLNRSTEPAILQYHSGGGQMKVVLDLDIVTNVGGTDPFSNNGLFDQNAFIVEMVLSLNPSASITNYSVGITAYYRTDQSSPFTVSKTVTATNDFSSVDTSQNTAFATFEVGEIAGNDSSLSISKGETKRVILKVNMTEGVPQQIQVQFSTPPGNTGQIELCAASVVSVGKNIPCLRPNIIQPVYSSRAGSLYKDIATFTLGYVCNYPYDHGVDEANTIEFEAYFRLLTSVTILAGDNINVYATVNVFGVSISVSPITFTVTDTFVDKYKLSTSVEYYNASLLAITVDQLALNMTVGQVITVPITVTVPRNSVAKMEVDVDLPENGTACLTVEDIRLITTGKNIACLEYNVTSGKVYTPTYNNTLGNNQRPYGYLSLGIVTNMGISHRQGTYLTGDDDVHLEADIMMCDCIMAENLQMFKMSFGAKTAQFVVLHDYNVTVFRDGSEKPDIELITSIRNDSNSNMVYLECLMKHTNVSAAEGRNTSAFIYLPPYLIPPVSVINNNMTTSVFDTSSPGMVEVQFTEFLFADVASFVLALMTNTSSALPSEISESNTILVSQVGTDFIVRFGTTLSGQSWYPYWTSVPQNLTASVSVGSGMGCSDNLGMQSGLILDCQISSSFENDPAGPPAYGRVNGPGFWIPHIRSKSFASLRYFQVHFGKLTRVTQIQVQHMMTKPNRASKLTIAFSNDGKGWTVGEMITLSTFDETVMVNSPVEARYIRLYITNDTAFQIKPSLGLRFEFFGCYTSNDLPNPLCPAVTPDPTDFYHRSFGVCGGNMFACDLDPNDKYGHQKCVSTTDGNSFRGLDESLGSLLGCDGGLVRMYGYANNKQSIMASDDLGLTWHTVSQGILTLSKASVMWTAAKNVPFTTTLLDQFNPDASYTIGSWGATYSGMMMFNGVTWNKVLDWSTTCCP